MKYKLQLLVVGEYTRINLFYHSLNLQKRIHRPKNTVLSYVYNVLPQEEKDVLDVMNLIEEDENQVSEKIDGLDKEIDFDDTELGETMDMPTESFFQGEME